MKFPDRQKPQPVKKSLSGRYTTILTWVNNPASRRSPRTPRSPRITFSTTWKIQVSGKLPDKPKTKKPPLRTACLSSFSSNSQLGIAFPPLLRRLLRILSLVLNMLPALWAELLQLFNNFIIPPLIVVSDVIRAVTLLAIPRTILTFPFRHKYMKLSFISGPSSLQRPSSL